MAAANGDVESAASKVMACRKWRDDNNVDKLAVAEKDGILGETVELLQATDEAGHPVMAFYYSPFNTQKVWDSAFKWGENRLMWEWVRAIEEAIYYKLSFAKDQPTAFTIIHDFRHAPTNSLWLSSSASRTLSNILLTFLDFYPEFAVRHIGLHAPNSSSVILSSSLRLSQASRAKVFFPTKGRELLSLTRFVRISELPVALGGFAGICPVGAKVGRAEAESKPTEISRARCVQSGRLRCAVAMLRGSADVSLFLVNDNDTKERTPTALGHVEAGDDPCYTDLDVEQGCTVVLYLTSTSWFETAEALYAIGRSPVGVDGTVRN